MSPMPTAIAAKTTAPFKSDRAARAAFTRAENVWDAKRSEGWAARDTYRAHFREHSSMDSAEYERLLGVEKTCEAEAAVLFEVMRGIYTRATAQGIGWISSSANWHFGHCPTRDLIAANMD